MKFSVNYIATLILKKISEQLTEAETVILEDWKNASAANQQQFNELLHLHVLQQELKNYREAQKVGQKLAVPRILVTDPSTEFSTHSAHRIHFLKTNWFKYAAAIIIMLGVASYLWFNHTTSNPVNQNNPLNPSSDIIAGSNRATLTLANGQQIILDSTQGNVVKQGNLTVVNLAGKLKYEGIGTATEYNTISTPKGGQYQIVLPDGSKVWLNAVSSIKFPTAFTGTRRNVEMTGEAYIEVEKNPKQPFVVTLRQAQGNGTEIEVLGTSFNVNAYAQESAVKTTLIDGSVKINHQVILKPGQQAEIAEGTDKKINVQSVNVDQVMAWKNGLFNFDNSDLRSALAQLERWYDIKIVYKGDESNGVTLEGKMYRNVNLSNVLEFLRKMGVKFRMDNKTLVVL